VVEWVQIRPVPSFGGLSAAVSSGSPSLLERDFLFFRPDLMDGGGVLRMKRVKSSPGRTARGGVSKDVGGGDMGCCWSVDGGGRASFDMVVESREWRVGAS
jgi:hypothetical protein